MSEFCTSPCSGRKEQATVCLALKGCLSTLCVLLKQAVICALLLVFVTLAAWKMRRRTVCGLEVHGYPVSHT